MSEASSGDAAHMAAVSEASSGEAADLAAGAAEEPGAGVCPSCGEAAPAGANWCEACGSDLAAEPAPACVSCGEREISPEGYCMSCGHKQPAERDHMVFEDGPAVAVSDRGRRHHDNEDAAAVGQLDGGGAVLVVCDGVSSTPGSAEASMSAAVAARDLLVAQLRGPEGPVDPDVSDPGVGDPGAVTGGANGVGGVADEDGGEVLVTGLDQVATALRAATEVAQARAAAAPEVVSNAPHAVGGPPSSTFVAAVGRPVPAGTEVSVAWLGDSRAYWIDDEAALLLTEDHEISGSLTRWLGADSDEPIPDVSHHVATSPGRLLLCSDGLWRYAETPAQLKELVDRLESESDSAVALADALVEFAKDAGGHDNITVALWSADTEAVAVPNGPQGVVTPDE